MTRILRVNRMWAAFAVAFATALVVVTAASADTAPVPFAASGIAVYGDTGDVKAAGNSGRFVVKDRTVAGVFVDPAVGVYGTWSLDFGTNVSIDTQEGQLHGKGFVQFGYDAPIDTSVQATSIYGGGCGLVGIVPDPYGVLPYSEQLFVSGTFTFTNGDQGSGDVNAVVCFVRTLDGHIGAFTGGLINLSGEWHPL